jgi:hypothetical protein
MVAEVLEPLLTALFLGGKQRQGTTIQSTPNAGASPDIVSPKPVDSVFPRRVPSAGLLNMRSLGTFRVLSQYNSRLDAIQMHTPRIKISLNVASNFQGVAVAANCARSPNGSGVRLK